MSKVISMLWIIVFAVVIVAGCADKQPGESNNSTIAESNWDQMKWDQDKWK